MANVSFGPTDATPTDTRVPPDTAFAALADPRRRAVLSYLDGRRGEIVAIGTLAEVVSAEASAPVREVAASLSVIHLPTLHDHGLIEYDPKNGWVRYTGSALVTELLAEVDAGVVR